MKNLIQWRLILSLLVGWSPFFFWPSTAAAQRIFSDYGSAEAAAKAAGKPFLVIFEQEGCPDCARMEAALSGGQASAALEGAIVAKLNYQDVPRLSARYSISATPTTVLIDTRRGSTVMRRVGSMSGSELVSLGRRMASMARGATAETDGAGADGEEPTQRRRGESSSDNTSRVRRFGMTDADVDANEVQPRRETRRERQLRRQQELAQQAEEATVAQPEAAEESSAEPQRYYLWSWR